MNGPSTILGEEKLSQIRGKRRRGSTQQSKEAKPEREVSECQMGSEEARGRGQSGNKDSSQQARNRLEMGEREASEGTSLVGQLSLHVYPWLK